MARVASLFSGSTGNSTYISSGNTSVLIDAGVSGKAINEALINIGATASDIKAVAVTHEHIDHIKGLKPFLKTTGAMLYASSKTLEALADMDKIPAGIKTICAEEDLDLGEIKLSRFATSHDCEGSSGFTALLSTGAKISLCTDLGVMSDDIRACLSGSDLVFIESNHDIDMLKRGPYPPELKVRILSDKGHLSNNACAAELPELLRSGATRIVLSHISQHNNLPMLASNAAKRVLGAMGAEMGSDYLLYTAKPKDNGVIVL
ncbi:MAG: MBL fold metallo-hydrolase [Clostridia bacterium]|nr:MBL fold metallo-hydrolase [Clostridia bacterium]